MSKKVTIDLDKDGCYAGASGYQMSINVVDENDYGTGYRLFGPKYAGCQAQRHIRSYTLDEDDVAEIRRALDEVFPQNEVPEPKVYGNAREAADHQGADDAC